MEEALRRAGAAGQTREGTKVLFMLLCAQAVAEGAGTGNPLLQAEGAAALILGLAIIAMEWRDWLNRNEGPDRPSAMEMIQDRAVVWPLMFIILVAAPLRTAARAARERQLPGPPGGESGRESRRIMNTNIAIAWLTLLVLVLEAA